MQILKDFRDAGRIWRSVSFELHCGPFTLQLLPHLLPPTKVGISSPLRAFYASPHSPLLLPSTVHPDTQYKALSPSSILAGFDRFWRAPTYSSGCRALVALELSELSDFSLCTLGVSSMYLPSVALCGQVFDSQLNLSPNTGR